MDDRDLIKSYLTLDEINNISIDHRQQPLKLKKAGKQLAGECPSGHGSISGKPFCFFEADRKFNCFHCGLGGDFINYVQFIIEGYVTKGSSSSIGRAFKYLRVRYGLTSDEEIKAWKESRSLLDNLELVFDDYHAQFKALPESERNRFKDHYGFTDKFIDQEKIGYTEYDEATKYSDAYDGSKEDFLLTGLFYENGSPLYRRRYVFPYEIDGTRSYSIGRLPTFGDGCPERMTPYKSSGKYIKQLINKSDYPHVSPLIKNQIIRTQGESTDIVITEGIPDYYALKQLGIHCCSPVTTKFKASEAKEIVNICRGVDIVYIANDNEKTGAGESGASETAKVLIESGIDPFIIDLPLPEGYIKMDVNEYLRDISAAADRDKDDAAREAFRKLKCKAKTYIQLQIEKIDKDLRGEQLRAALKPVFDLLKYLSEDHDNDYIGGSIKVIFGLNNPQINALKKKVRDKRKEFDKGKNGIPITDSELLDSIVDFSTCLKKGQDFIGGKLIYTRVLHSKVGNKITATPIVISSGDKRWERLDEGLHTKSGLMLKEPLDLGEEEDWWTSTGSDFSAQKYMKGETDIDPAKLFVRIRNFFSKYSYLPDPYDYDTLALNVMATSNFMIFDTIGYPHFIGLKNSGKTTVLSIIATLAFKGSISASRSDATIFRATEDGDPTMIFDEADDFNLSIRARENAPSIKLALCNAGYQKDGKAYRSDGDKHKTKAFSCYGPKYFGGTKELDPILSSRTIKIEMTQPPEGADVERSGTKEYKQEAKTLRDQICCYGLQHASRLEYIYEEVLYQSYYEEFKKNGVAFREFDLYKSLLCQALLIDECDSSLKVFDAIKEKSFKGAVKKKLVSEKDPEMEVLEKFYLFAKGVIERPPAKMDKYYYEGWFFKQGLISFFIDEVLKSDYEEKLYEKWSFKILEDTLKKMDILEGSDIRQYMNTSEGGVRKKGKAIKIDLDRILRKLLLIESSLSGEIKEDISNYKEKNNLIPKKSQIELDAALLD